MTANGYARWSSLDLLKDSRSSRSPRASLLSGVSSETPSLSKTTPLSAAICRPSSSAFEENSVPTPPGSARTSAPPNPLTLCFASRMVTMHLLRCCIHYNTIIISVKFFFWEHGEYLLFKPFLVHLKTKAFSVNNKSISCSFVFTLV